MVNLQYPFKGQQVLTLIGSEQTTSSLVVMIDETGQGRQSEERKQALISRRQGGK